MILYPLTSMLAVAGRICIGLELRETDTHFITTRILGNGIEVTKHPRLYYRVSLTFFEVQALEFPALLQAYEEWGISGTVRFIASEMFPEGYRVHGISIA